MAHLARGRYPYLDVPRPFGFAHRGGSALFPENTSVAFDGAVALGYTHIETDLHLTRDGVFVILHDPLLERTTDGAGDVRTMSLAEVQAVDAGYRFPGPNGDYPHRGRGVTVPTLDEVLERFPDTFFNLEMKHEMALPLWRFIEDRGMHDRILVGCADEGLGRSFRSLARGRVPTSPGVRGVLDFWSASRLGLDRVRSYDFEALQVPPTQGPLTVVDRRFTAAARRHGIQVHVWTIDEEAEMRRLFGLGVDAVMTDRPDILRAVLSETQ